MQRVKVVTEAIEECLVRHSSLLDHVVGLPSFIRKRWHLFFKNLLFTFVSTSGQSSNKKACLNFSYRPTRVVFFNLTLED